MKKKFPVFSAILYALGALMLIYSAWALQKSISYVAEMISYGQVEFKGSEYDIISFILSSCGTSPMFAVTFFALGWIMQKYTLVRADEFAPVAGAPVPEWENGKLESAETPVWEAGRTSGETSAEEVILSEVAEKDVKVAFEPESEDKEV